MIEILRCDHTNLEFQMLVRQLDEELTIIDGDDHDFYHQFNGIDNIKYAVVLFYNNQAAGCGAIKPLDGERVEIKRMYVNPEYRKKGLSVNILNELEQWAKELGYKSLVLETGKRQHAAIGLYQNHGFIKTDNYPPYVDIDNSVCFKKQILPTLEH